jgi:hypothetical protein
VPATTGEESTRALVTNFHALLPLAASIAWTALSRPPMITLPAANAGEE